MFPEVLSSFWGKHLLQIVFNSVRTVRSGMQISPIPYRLEVYTENKFIFK